MRTPFNFEAEPFEFDSEFQEETESFDAYKEEQCRQSCQCTRCAAAKAGLPAEYEEEQPDADSEFDGEWDEFDTELADSEWEEERGRRMPIRRTSFRPRPRFRLQPFGRLPKPRRPIPPKYSWPLRRPPIIVVPEPVAVSPEPPIVEPWPQDAEPTEPGDSQPSGPEDTQAAEPGTEAQAKFDSEGETRGSVAGRWVRQGHMIIVDDPRPSARAADREIARNFSRSAPRFPAKPADSVESPSPLPVLLFPPKPADPLTASLKMEGALKSAIAKLEKDRKLKPGTFPVRFTFVEITDPSGSFPSAGFLETKTDYIASEAKVAVMYSAYALRDMVERFAASTGANSANLFVRLAKEMDPSIIKASKNIARSLLMDVHRVPSYRNVFAMQPATWGVGVTVAFTPGFNSALEGMIVPSNNVHAGTCVRGVGYGYLNGALAEGDFFNPSNDQGLWVAGDFQQGKKWPYVRIVSSNDGLVAQAGTTRDMAKLVALIMTDRVLDPASCNEMRGRLAKAAKGIDTPWVARTGVFKAGTITHNKLGLGPLKSGKLVRSEVSVYQSPVARGRRYVVAWHNLVGLQPIGLADIARIIKSMIAEFEK
jgi:hypothetical protein